MGDRRGWRVVGAVAVLLACVAGFGFYSLTVFVHALTADGVFTLSQVSRGSALLLVAAGLGGVGVAAVLSRVDVRWVLATGALVMAVGLLLLGRVRTTGGLYGADLLMGLGQAAAGVVPGTTVVARWFVHRRSTAMAVASTGLSVGGILVAPLVGFALQHASLRSVTSGSAVVFLVVCLLVVPLVAPRPDGGQAEHAPLEEGLSRAEALRTQAFWGITVAMALAVLAQVGGLTHLYTMVARRGSSSVAGVALSCVAVGSLSGRFVGSWVLTRLSTSAFFRLLLVTQCAALMVLSAGHGALVLLGASVAFGFTIGNVVLSQPLLLGEVFGLRDFARVLSFSQLVGTAGTAGGPLLVGMLASTGGGYSTAYLVAGSASLLGAMVLHATTAAREAVREAVVAAA